jgi:hypothetical protein
MLRAGVRLLAALPSLFARLEPLLERIGERGRQRYLARTPPQT